MKLAFRQQANAGRACSPCRLLHRLRIEVRSNVMRFLNSVFALALASPAIDRWRDLSDSTRGKLLGLWRPKELK